MSDKSILEYDISPFLQAAVILGAIVVFILGGRLIALTGLIDVDQGTPWLVACSFTLLYAIFSSVLSISALDQNKYWMQSIIGYVGIVVLGGVLAYFFSGVNMDEVGAYKLIYMIFTLGYVILLGVVRSMRKIVKIAQEQDKRLRGED